MKEPVVLIIRGKEKREPLLGCMAWCAKLEDWQRKLHTLCKDERKTYDSKNSKSTTDLPSFPEILKLLRIRRMFWRRELYLHIKVSMFWGNKKIIWFGFRMMWRTQPRRFILKLLIIKRAYTPKLRLKLNSMEVVTGMGSLYTEIVTFIQSSSSLVYILQTWRKQWLKRKVESEWLTWYYFLFRKWGCLSISA